MKGNVALHVELAAASFGTDLALVREAGLDRRDVAGSALAEQRLELRALRNPAPDRGRNASGQYQQQLIDRFDRPGADRPEVLRTANPGGSRYGVAHTIQSPCGCLTGTAQTSNMSPPKAAAHGLARLQNPIVNDL